MATRSPSSRGALRLKWSTFDVAWAALAPYFALAIRESYILSYKGAQTAALYWLISFMFSLIAFAAFRLRDGMAHYFSVHDAIEVAKAVLAAEFLVCLVLFTLTRLDGVPRSTPIIHALVLGVGLMAARGLARFSAHGRMTRTSREIERKYVIMIGVSRLTTLYMKLLESIAPGAHRIIAVLDDAPDSWGRSVNGVQIMGPAAELESIVEEFAVHGIQADRVVAGLDPSEMPNQVLEEIRRICRERNMELDFAPGLFGLTSSVAQRPSAADFGFEASLVPEPPLALPFYIKVKPYLDFLAALVLLAVLAPFFLVAICLTLVDVGFPIFFWQQRIGIGGSSFLLYKFRTLRMPFDEQRRKLTEEQRLSRIGHFMRRTRLDELPQLLNVLFCDMSLVGPRPLLPRDQPKDATLRLMVRPGMTGWAQVNGGVLLSGDEKERLDGWYVRNASLWLDLRIAVMTAITFVRGDRRTRHLELALSRSSIQFNEPAPRRVTLHHSPVLSRVVARNQDRVPPPALRSS
jgi:lipopolysaccharide/colanic/teichoic acid biosynthesis glycosyltransferase